MYDLFVQRGQERDTEDVNEITSTNHVDKIDASGQHFSMTTELSSTLSP